jgi:hypothetical protein
MCLAQVVALKSKTEKYEEILATPVGSFHVARIEM